MREPARLRLALLVLLVLPLTGATALGQSAAQPSGALLRSSLQLAELEVDASAPLAGSAAPGAAATTFGSWTTPAKWITLGASAGFAILGFALHEQAEQDFRQLVALCESDAENCRDTASGGAFNDPALEELFQSVLSKDDWARVSLIAAQVMFGVTAALFIIDFQRKGGPADIPYEPPDNSNQLRVSIRPGEVAVKYYFH